MHFEGDAADPPLNCSLCERLCAFRAANRKSQPDWFNAPVPSFGPDTAQLLVVGLAPGLQGANRTGRPFTGDFAGNLLYATLEKFGFSNGCYDARADDGLQLVDCMVTNAVRCVPPQNKPVGSEIRQCGSFLSQRIKCLPQLQVIVALGRIAHDSTLSALSQKRSAFPFAHGAAHNVGNALALFDSYHCSRYNTNTKRLTPDMFENVFAAVSEYIQRRQACVCGKSK